MVETRKKPLSVQEGEDRSTSQRLLPEQKALTVPQTAPGIRLQYQPASTIPEQQTVFWHKNAQEPYKVDAQALLQGDHIYTAPGAEFLFRHELAHWALGHARRAVRTETRAGIPVCLEPDLEQQADRRAATLQPAEFPVMQTGPRPLDTRQPVLLGGHGKNRAKQPDSVLARYVNESGTQVFFRRSFTEYQRFLYWLRYAIWETSRIPEAEQDPILLCQRLTSQHRLADMLRAAPANKSIEELVLDLGAKLLGLLSEHAQAGDLPQPQEIANSLLHLMALQPHLLVSLATYRIALLSQNRQDPDQDPIFLSVNSFISQALPVLNMPEDPIAQARRLFQTLLPLDPTAGPVALFSNLPEEYQQMFVEQLFIREAQPEGEAYENLLWKSTFSSLMQEPDAEMNEESILGLAFSPLVEGPSEETGSGEAEGPGEVEEREGTMPLPLLLEGLLTPENSEFIFETLLQFLFETGVASSPDFWQFSLGMLQHHLSQLGQLFSQDESLYAPLLAPSFSFPEEPANLLLTLETPLETLEDALAQDPAEWIVCVCTFLQQPSVTPPFSEAEWIDWVQALFDVAAPSPDLSRVVHEILIETLGITESDLETFWNALVTPSFDTVLHESVLAALYQHLIDSPSLRTPSEVKNDLQNFLASPDFFNQVGVPTTQDTAKESGENILDSFHSFSQRKHNRTLALFSMQPRHIIPHSDIKGLVAVCFLPPSSRSGHETACANAWNAIAELVDLLCSEQNEYNAQIHSHWQILQANCPLSGAGAPLSNPDLRTTVETFIDLLANHPLNIFMGDGPENMDLGNRFDYAAASSGQVHPDFVNQLFDWWQRSLNAVGNTISYDYDHEVWQSAVSRPIPGNRRFGQPPPE